MASFRNIQKDSEVIMGKLRADLLSSIDDVDIEQSKLTEHTRLLIQLNVPQVCCHANVNVCIEMNGNAWGKQPNRCMKSVSTHSNHWAVRSMYCEILV